MAGEWIKMRTSLLTNPKVVSIARILENDPEVAKVLAKNAQGPMRDIVTRTVMRHVTVTLLLVIWGAANEHTKDGVFQNSRLSIIDDLTGITGFGAAMEAVGWAIYDEEANSVTLPNFNEYNTVGQERSASAKTNAERQREYRERMKLRNGDVTGDVTNNVTSNRREEKRREENIKEKNKKKSRSAVALSAFLDECKEQDIAPIPEDDPIFAYAAEAKIPDEFLFLHWQEFMARFKDNPEKHYKDWKAVFRRSVRDNWFKLWFMDKASGACALTTVGLQAQNVHRNKQ